MKKLCLLILLLGSIITHAQLRFHSLDINKSGNSSAEPPFWYNGFYYIAARDSVHGAELWYTDGTNPGTQLAYDFNRGTADGFPWYFCDYNGTLLLSAQDSAHGAELWAIDKVPSTAHIVKDIVVGRQSSYPRMIDTFMGKCYFFIQDSFNIERVYITDGTEAGTVPAPDIITGVQYKGGDYKAGINRFFFASTAAAGTELWVTDNTTAGTHMVKDISPGPASSAFSNQAPYLEVWNNRLLFALNTATSGSELWVSDGTDSGTFMLADICAGSQSGFAKLGAFLPGKYVFVGFEKGMYAGISSLWVTDGTKAGTYKISDCRPAYSNTNTMASLGNIVYFAARDKANNAGMELWRTDGTDAGTYMFKDLASSLNAESDPQLLRVYKHHLFFSADTLSYGNLHDRQLFISDGTDAGTHTLSPPGSSQKDPLSANFFSGFWLVDSSMYFRATYDTTGNELWWINGEVPEQIVTSSKLLAVQLDVYPNPNKGNFIIRTEGGAEGMLAIYNTAGKLILSKEVTDTLTVIHLDSAFPGIYFIKLQNNNTIRTARILVK